MKRTTRQEVTLLKGRVSRLRTRTSEAELLRQHQMTDAHVSRSRLHDLCDELERRVTMLSNRCSRLEDQQRKMVDGILGVDGSGPGVSVAAAARRTGVSGRAIYGMIERAGTSAALRLDGQIRIPEEALPFVKDGVTWPWQRRRKPSG